MCVCVHTHIYVCTHTHLASYPFFGKFRTVFCSVFLDFHFSLTKMKNTPLHFLDMCIYIYIFFFYSFIVFHCVVLIMLYATHPVLQIFWLFPVFVTINNTVVNSFVHTYSCPAARLPPPPPAGPVCLLNGFYEVELLSEGKCLWNFAQYWQIPFCRVCKCHTAFIPELYETYCFHKFGQNTMLSN